MNFISSTFLFLIITFVPCKGQDVYSKLEKSFITCHAIHGIEYDIDSIEILPSVQDTLFINVNNSIEWNKNTHIKEAIYIRYHISENNSLLMCERASYINTELRNNFE